MKNVILKEGSDEVNVSRNPIYFLDTNNLRGLLAYKVRSLQNLVEWHKDQLRSYHKS